MVSSIYANTLSKNNIAEFIDLNKIPAEYIIHKDINDDHINDYMVKQYDLHENVNKLILFVSNNSAFNLHEVNITSSGFGFSNKSKIFNIQSNKILIIFEEKNGIEGHLLSEYNKRISKFCGKYAYFKLDTYDAYGNVKIKQTYVYVPNFIIGINSLEDIMDNTPFYIEAGQKWTSSFNKKNIDALISINPITAFNSTIYNDTAYYLQQAGANQESAYLLEKIIEKFPDRTVAYFNLGDAYYSLGDKEKATQAYQIYIDQMEKKGWEKKIPKRVLDRVGN